MGLPVATALGVLLLEASGTLAPEGATGAGSTGSAEPDDGTLPVAAAAGVADDQADQTAELGLSVSAAGVARVGTTVLVMIDGIGTVTTTVAGPLPQPTLHTAELT